MSERAQDDARPAEETWLAALFTAQEVSERLGVSERTVRRWIKSGRLEAQKVGRGYRIDLEAARACVGQVTAGGVAAELESLRGEVTRLENEVEWLRGVVEGVLRGDG